MFDVVREPEEINRVRNWAAEGYDNGGRYPGMSYEQGIMDVLALRG